MVTWTVEKIHHWHVCRDGVKFAMVDDEPTANEIIRICNEMEGSKVGYRCVCGAKYDDYPKPMCCTKCGNRYMERITWRKKDVE
jgi:hypothetical protein